MTLREFFEENPVCAVAFSGGVDSAVLLSAAAAYGRKTAAYFVRTVFQPVFELEDARDIARRLDVPLTAKLTDALKRRGVSLDSDFTTDGFIRAVIALKTGEGEKP